MDADQILSSSPECRYHLVSSTEAVSTRSQSIIARLDEIPGVQAEIEWEDLLTDDPYDSILRSAKVNSRYGKPLVEVYVETIRERLEQVKEAALTEELEAQFRKNDADPYQAALTGDVLTIGIDIKSKLEEALDEPEELSFDPDDLAAAVGFAAEREDVRSEGCYGTVVVTLDEPLSEAVARRSTGGISTIVQRLLLCGLDVYLVGPRGGSDELKIVRDHFRSIGSFSVEEEAQVEFDVPEATRSFVDKWYDRLSFDVADGRVGESVIRPASVAAYDLPEGEERRHFFRAITDGLQIAYAEQKADNDRFEQLWSERITPHPQYDQYRSQRSDFPTVTLARTDGRQRTCRFTYRGPNTRPYIDGVQVRSGDIEETFIGILERFLDATVIGEDRWQEVVDEIQTRLGTHLDVDAEAIARNALLRRSRIRSELRPILGPDTGSEEGSPSSGGDRGVSWYREHWRTILSGHEITTTAGSRVIERKQELCSELDPESVADAALYCKLRRDIENAWGYYLSSLEEQIRLSLPDELGIDIEQHEAETRTDIEVSAHPPDGDPVTATVSIYIPFSDVRVDDEPVSRANVPQVVSRMLEGFEGVLYSRTERAAVTTEDLLLELIRLYCSVADVEAGDLVYFEEIVTFARDLPDMAEAFQEPNQDIESSLYQKLGSEQLIGTLRSSGVRFHRKGSDDRRSVKVSGDQFIAMELGDGVP